MNTEENNQKEIINLPIRRLKIEPLTKEELHKTTLDRVSFISKELTNGFDFLIDHPKSVTIFGGEHFKETDPEYEKAKYLAKRIVKETGYSLLTGGGAGIMEAANRGAVEAGGQSLGLTIELPQHQIQNKYLSKAIHFHYFFTRKVCLGFSAEAYVFFPGGFGTMDEFFEILTLVQTGKIEKVPIILFDSSFWKPLEDLIKKEMLGRETIDATDLNLYLITDSADEALEIIRNAPLRNNIEFKHGEETVTS